MLQYGAHWPLCVCVCLCVCVYSHTHTQTQKHKHKHTQTHTGQGTISWNTGRSFQGFFAEDCPIAGELTELDGNVYRVTYAGNLKFQQGAKPVSQELIRTQSGVAAAAEGRQDAANAFFQLRAPTTATLSVPAAGAAAMAAGGETTATGAGQWDDWEPFAEIVPVASPAAGAATVRTVADVGRPAPIECNTEMSTMGPGVARGLRRQAPAASDCESEDSCDVRLGVTRAGNDK